MNPNQRRIITPGNGRPGGAAPEEQVQVRIPAVHLQTWGDRAAYHTVRHAKKLQKCNLDCGVDLYPYKVGEVSFTENWAEVVCHTGVHMAFPPGTFGRIVARSSSFRSLNGGMVVDGTIDAGYTGELFVIIRCLRDDFEQVKDAINECIDKEKALSQVIVTPFYTPVFVAPQGMMLTGRGADGFGSTDITKG